MSDNNAHPGVRSLLAKFENSQSPITSPPSRGRSPVGSDTPGSTRPLSKVRASFVTVEGAIQSNPGSPLRKTSGRGDSTGIFGPKINMEEIESRRQDNVISPTPAGHDKSPATILESVVDKAQSEQAAMVTKERKVSESQESSAPAESAASLPEATQAPKEKPASIAPTTTDSGVSSEKQKAAPKTVTKRPSNVHTAKHNTINKPTAHTTASTSSRTTTTNGSAKPTSAREVAKERASALAHKPSRPSLNPAKTTARATRGATPCGDAHKPFTGSTTTKPRSKSPTRPVRLPSSMTAQTQSSNAKHGSPGPATGRTEKPAASLTRKPSSFKSAAAPTGAVRRQSSRPSLPTQPAPERPSSRVSDIGAKPVNESFLARMMRPTASSASKTHDKSEIKAPPKPTASKAPRSSMGRASERGVTQAKAKTTALKPQSEKSQPVSKEGPSNKEEVKVPQKAQENEKENIEEVAAAIPEEPSATETNDAIVEEPEPEVPSKAAGEDVAEKPAEPAVTGATHEPSSEPILKPTQPSAETAVEVSAEPVATNALEASNPQEETTDNVEVSAEVSTIENTHESREQEVVPDVKDTEELSIETAIETNGEKESSDSQPEPEAPRDAAIREAEEAPEAEPELPDLPEQTEATTSVSNDDTLEASEDVNEAHPSEKIEEPKESVPAVESAPPAKPDTVDIDFASLALS